MISPKKALLYSIPLLALFVVAGIVSLTAPGSRSQALGIVTTVTALTCSSLIAFVFLLFFTGRIFRSDATARSRIFSFLLALVSFGAGIGSTALLKYVLPRLYK
jgi:hypothetical protein